MELHEFSDKELERAKRRLNQKYFLRKLTYINQQPIGILLGGQPASGKTRLFDYVQKANSEHKFIEINGDEYRQYHPRAQEIDEEYGQNAPKYTQPFSNALVEYVKAECLRLRCNFIIEGTMRTYAVIERTAREIKQAGFLCEAHALAVHRQDSLLGVFQRFESDKQRTGVGRFSPIDIHDEAYRQIPLNLAKADQDKLFNRIVIYTRKAGGQLEIGLERTNTNSKSIDFSSEFDYLRQPIFDTIFYQNQWLALSELAQNRGETDRVYLNHIKEFIRLFR
ncbi:hypothetical protein GO755_29940 [Spirosoma sp. HMF4905]|uniref:Zeta toxin domain-containing protein n=1 Tax=Spirosoma arboris TaxID=2682092 RepID=A0A7K1SKG7_9BACT|nr:zeta toxin family protein [Spirosoma arboris]MVM34290.1 hypothetical protein [Spirosoma arboris]